MITNRRNFLKVLAIVAATVAAPVPLSYAYEDKVELQEGETILRCITSVGALYFKLPYEMERRRIRFPELSFQAEKTMTIYDVEILSPITLRYVSTNIGKDTLIVEGVTVSTNEASII